MYVVTPSKLAGSVPVPPSKSQTLRALVFALLAEGTSRIERPLDSPDVEAMLTAATLLGADVIRGEEWVEVTGRRLEGAENVLDVGNSGLLLRFLGAVCALSPAPIVLTGDHSVRTRRPVEPLLGGLRQLGARAERLGGPILVQGPLQGGTVHLPGEDSQPVSGLLIAGSFAQEPVELFVSRPGEKPWVELTLAWLDRLGLPYERSGGEFFRLPGQGSVAPFTYRVPGDVSSAAFPLAAALVTRTSVTVEGLDLDDPQGDRLLLDLFEQMGARVTRGNTHVTVEGGELRAGSFDLNACIDALPILAAVACFAEGTTELFGIEIARRKESDRLAAMAGELTKMGAHIDEREDRLVIRGRPLHGARVHSHYDHRVAMALTVAGLGASEQTIVEQVGCVAKTYRTFPDHLRHLGAHITCI